MEKLKEKVLLLVVGCIIGVVFMGVVNIITYDPPKEPTQREVLNQVVEKFACNGYDQRGLCKSVIGHLNYLNKNGLD